MQMREIFRGGLVKFHWSTLTDRAVPLACLAPPNLAGSYAKPVDSCLARLASVSNCSSSKLWRRHYTDLLLLEMVDAWL